MSLPLAAYPDSKCTYGYMVLCDRCRPDAPHYVAKDSPLSYPPNVGKAQQCEMCKRQGVLFTASDKLSLLIQAIEKAKAELRERGWSENEIDELLS